MDLAHALEADDGGAGCHGHVGGRGARSGVRAHRGRETDSRTIGRPGSPAPRRSWGVSDRHWAGPTVVVQRTKIAIRVDSDAPGRAEAAGLLRWGICYRMMTES